MDLVRLTDKLTKQAHRDRLSGYLHAKSAQDAEVSRRLAGRLYLSSSGWLLLSVPNALGEGLFSALDEPGVELPKKDGRYSAHISVMRPEEIEQIPGGAAAITERGKVFHYRLGPLVSFNPIGWEEMSRCWVVQVESPELKALRRSYGLPPLPMKGDKELPFHITVGVRRTNVLRTNEVSKVDGSRGERKEAAGPLSESFVNELGNEISLQADDTEDGLVNYQMAGPSSVMDNTITRQEALRLQAILAALSGRWGQAKAAEYDDSVEDSCPSCPACGSDDTHHARAMRVEDGKKIFCNATCDSCRYAFSDPDYGKSQKQASSEVLQQLQQAKSHSDKKEWDRKNALLRQLMLAYPEAFVVDAPKGRNWGVTHRPTNFRYHMPPAAIPQQVKQAQPFDQSFLWRAFQATPFRWQQGQGLGNLWDYAQKLHHRASEDVARAYNGQELRDALLPGHRWQRLNDILAGRGSVVSHPADRLALLERT